MALGPFPLYVLLIRSGTLLFCLVQLLQLISFKCRLARSHFYFDVAKMVFQQLFYYLSKQNFDVLCHYYEQLLKLHSLSEAYSYECIVKTFHMSALTYYASVFL